MTQEPSTTGVIGVASTPRSAITAPQVDSVAGGGPFSGGVIIAVAGDFDASGATSIPVAGA